MTPPPASTDEEPAADFARPVLERQLAGLDELAEVGLTMVRNLAAIVARQAGADEPNPDFDVPAMSLAYHRTARAVRMSYALQEQVIEQLRRVERIEAARADDDRRARQIEAQAEARAAEAAAAGAARKAQVAEALTGIIAESDRGDREGRERHVREASERLRDPDVLGRPTSEVIAAICRDLGLDPDWQGLAAEAWALEELQSDNVGEPLRAPPKRASRPPPPEPLPTPPIEPPPKPAIEKPVPAEVAAPPPPPPYRPPPDPDVLPGYEVGLPGELPPLRPDGRRSQPAPPTNFTRGFI